MLGNKTEQKTASHLAPKLQHAGAGPASAGRVPVAMDINYGACHPQTAGFAFCKSASLPEPSAAPALEFSRWDHFPQIPLARFIAALFFVVCVCVCFFFNPPLQTLFKSLNYYSTLHISPGLYSVSLRLFAPRSLHLQL